MQVDVWVVLILAIPILASAYRLGEWRECKRMRRQMKRVEQSRQILRELLEDKK